MKLNHLGIYKEEKFKTMFFTLKILALFFCSIPLFQHFVGELTQLVIINNVLISALTVLLLILALTFIWMFMDNQRDNNKAVYILEVCLFFVVCNMAIYYSGLITSYYKFVFIFMIVLYTIEFGMKTGLIVATCASIVLLGADLLLYDQAGVNPYFENDFAMCAMFVMVAWALGYYVRIANSHINRLSDYANIDGLTEVYNHRYFYETLKKACEDSVKSDKPLSLIILDIDHFKIYNDIYGHQQGDITLKELADILKDFISAGVICRYGGEEFTIILNDTDLEKASKIANDLCQHIAAHCFYGQEHLPGGNFTVSMGVSELQKGNDTYSGLVKRADLALYRAKYLRRNSVEVYASILEGLNIADDNHDLKETLNSLKTLINIIDSRDSYTYRHTERVVMLCMTVAEHLELSDQDKRRLCYAAYLHDLGKINIAKEILISDKKLTANEWEELKNHPDEGANIISKVEGLEDIVPIIRQHHERYDGNGYPKSLKGVEIDYLARILTLADSFDAMTSRRPYQPAKTYTQAFSEIEDCSGTQFDPELAKKFIEAVKTKCSDNSYELV